mmetsp:Transcript_26469/g.84193  ORF Transcript_26469/g.84193 Transcript_26469/m.84193 type:complete len:308 (-) Transcript_26469:914-1837(-)
MWDSKTESALGPASSRSLLKHGPTIALQAVRTEWTSSRKRRLASGMIVETVRSSVKRSTKSLSWRARASRQRQVWAGGASTGLADGDWTGRPARKLRTAAVLLPPSMPARSPPWGIGGEAASGEEKMLLAGVIGGRGGANDASHRPVRSPMLASRISGSSASKKLASDASAPNRTSSTSSKRKRRRQGRSDRSAACGPMSRASSWREQDMVRRTFRFSHCTSTWNAGRRRSSHRAGLACTTAGKLKAQQKRMLLAKSMGCGWLRASAVARSVEGTPLARRLGVGVLSVPLLIQHASSRLILVMSTKR